MNEKIVFNYKSNWYENTVISKIGIEGLWVYFNIRKFKLQYCKDICVFSLDLLHKEIQSYYKENNRKYSTSNIRDIIFQLKKYKIINFDRKYSMKNTIDLCYCELLDLPNLDNKYKPLSDNDYYITVDTDTINGIFDKGLNEKHIAVYYCLKKYINVQGTPTGQINLSYEKMSEWLGINKETANIYAIELEKNKIIANEYTKSKAGHKCNSFIISNNKNLGQDSTISEIAEKNNIKRLKKKLQNNKIKVTVKAFDNMEEYIELMTETEKDHIKELNEKNIVYAIEYFYFELLDALKERKNNKDNFITDVRKRQIEVSQEENLPEPNNSDVPKTEDIKVVPNSVPPSPSVFCADDEVNSILNDEDIWGEDDPLEDNNEKSPFHNYDRPASEVF
ncbi:hypothetical protein HBE96_23465 [Clostridium sp. P21]|uniref:Uncharacterized protein n=1 Tax=Clostridium muellerianum TaxID=2716538 RepID=A0A7Y0ELA9_9CLOT|nr:hypothetical protein [Clostridium muellerianum]NMM65540.1 hypothetical protein [Clostridium muellerianum]